MNLFSLFRYGALILLFSSKFPNVALYLLLDC